MLPVSLRERVEDTAANAGELERARQVPFSCSAARGLRYPNLPTLQERQAKRAQLACARS